MFKYKSNAEENKIRVLLVDLFQGQEEAIQTLEKACLATGSIFLKALSLVEAQQMTASAPIAVVVFNLSNQTHIDQWDLQSVRQWQVGSRLPFLFLVRDTCLKHTPNFLDGFAADKLVDLVSVPLDQKVMNTKISLFVELLRKEMLIQKQSSLLFQNESRTKERVLAEFELKALQREQQAQQNYRDLVEGISDCIIWAADVNLVNISFVSSRAENILGYSLQRWFFESNFFMSCVHPDDRFYFDGAVDRLRSGVANEIAFEHRFLKSNGTHLWVHTSLRLVGNELRGLSADITRIKDTEDALRSSEYKLRFLVDVTALLNGSLDYKNNLTTVCRRIVDDFADWCVVDLVSENGTIERAQFSYAKESMASLANSLMTAYPPALAADSASFSSLRKLGVTFVMAIPLVARQQVLGSVSFGYCLGSKSYRQEDQMIAQELGRRMSVAIDNAKLYRAEQKARYAAQGAQLAAERSARRIAKLQGAAVALSEAMTSDQVGKVAATQGLSAMEAASAFLVLNNSQQTQIQVSEFSGLMEGNINTSSVEWALLQETINSGNPAFVESPEKLNKSIFCKRSPFVNGLQAYASIPFVIHGRTEGALCLVFREKRMFSRNDQAFMLGLARQCAQALDRAQIYELEKKARNHAEQEERRRAFLAEASLVLAESLDYETTLKRVGQLAVLAIADLYLIHLLDTEGNLKLITVAHADPKKVILAEELYRDFKFDPQAGCGVAKAISSGESQLYSNVSTELAKGTPFDPHSKVIIEQFNLHSALFVPLKARGKTLGAMTLFLSESQAHYGQRDLAIAEDLARRAAIAIDNAYLYNDAQDAIRARDEFLSIASHELKTPLTPLKLQTQLIMRMMTVGKLGDVDPIKMQRILKTSDRQITRLSLLVEELLDISRLSVGGLRINTENFDLCELIGDVVEKFRDQLAQTSCSVEVVCPQSIVGTWDKFRMEQVFVNLLTNAMKYGPGKPIEIVVTSKNGMAEVKIRDGGIGIAKRDQKRIFQRFERAVSANHFGGLGLGLYIVSQVLDAHGGTIRVESELGHGSTFIIDLPCSGVSKQQAGPDSAA